MNRLLLSLSVISLALFPLGCEWLRKLSDTGSNGRRPVFDGPIEPKSREDLVKYLNRQSDAVQSLQYQSVKLSVNHDGQSHSLNDSDLICAKPRYFALSGGKAVFGEVVSVGSNNQEFWVYSRFPEEQFIFCRHDDFARGAAQLPIPFDSDWALQALGMKNYDSNKPYKVDTDEARREHRLSYDEPTAQGIMMKHTVVFAADSMGEKNPQIRQYIIQDMAGKPVATADIKEIMTLPAGKDRVTGKEIYVQVPSLIALDWPSQKFRMELSLRDPRLNEPMDEARKQALFSKPKKASIKPVNLAKPRSTYRSSPPR
ncbi:MAG: hypothetical protein ACRC8S_02390 [Fimbriiglobus sp.]